MFLPTRGRVPVGSSRARKHMGTGEHQCLRVSRAPLIIENLPHTGPRPSIPSAVPPWTSLAHCRLMTHEAAARSEEPA